MKSTILASLLSIWFFCTGCAMYGNPSSIETMEQTNFELLESDIKLVTSTSVILMKPDEDKEFALTLVASTLETVTREGLDGTLMEIIRREYPNIDPVILNIIELAQNRIKQYGGLPTDILVLSERDKRLIMAVVNGIHEGLLAVHEGTVRWGFIHEGYANQSVFQL